jgi:tetratricopeptide (TPR) repeat protein/opacity protein-like surface antigen
MGRAMRRATAIASLGAQVLLLVGVLPTLLASVASAETCAPVVGELVSVEGQVQIRRADAADWQQAQLNDLLCQRDSVHVGKNSRGTISLINDAVLRLDQNTTINLVDVAREPEERSIIDLVLGAFQSFSRSPHTLGINTPYLNATIEGTEFALRVESGRSVLTVFEGRVAAQNEYGKVHVSGGQSASAEAGKAPAPYVLVQPRDAVQWALYYPPIFAALGGQSTQPPPGLSAALAEAFDLAARRDFQSALAALDRVPEQERDAQYHIYRSALLLGVGQAADARTDIDRALTIDPQAGLAYALRAVINVVQDRKQDALTDAEQAVKLSPNEAAPKIALSYAQQAQFRLEAARDTLVLATTNQPNDALAWARLSELWLMLGHRDRAREAAARAATLSPNLARAQVVRGFAALVEFRTEEAKEAFTRAIALDSSDPLPRLGRGLALIHEGALERGRREIEVAAGLDSGNALIRAYLGKAYFEEKRDPLDADQFKMAKELDPLDPTAYFYDAIRKQTENRPGEALQDLQASIERNDNRAIYRSRQQLDEDRAARGASLARVYGDLGFSELGVNEASESLTLDPANASAHRFLSDAYQGVRRREIARVSELLQAQLLQDVNINPVQPSISETNLNIVTRGGPAQAGFNEFTPLFERNDIQLNLSGFGGNEDTFGGEGVVSALYDGLSISAGAFHYETDGFRPNNDINHDIYNIFAQYAVTPELNLQVELRHRESQQGDLALNFDPNNFDRNFDRDLNQDIARAGVRYSPTPNSDFLLSFIYSDREDEARQESTIFVPSDFAADSKADDEGYQIEGQYLYRRDWLNLTAGVSYTGVDRTLEDDATFLGSPLIDDTNSSEITHPHGYVYGSINLPDPLTWTVGLSVDDYAEGPLEVDKVNPKFGVQWNVTDNFTLRGAAFRTVKPALVANRTIEPTQIAGFNQFFDDVNGTEAWRWGVGADWRITNELFVGAEATWRDLNVPLLLDRNGDGKSDDSIQEAWDEQSHRAYLFWLPIPEVSLSAEFAYDRFESEKGTGTDASGFPRRVETFSIPLAARYFHPSGFFAGIGATFVDQEVDRSDAFAGGDDGSDSFFMLDAAIGWRLPNRIGIASLEVTNLLDEEFDYQDDSFREFRDEPTIGPYIPDRQIMGRITLNF